MVTFQHLCEGKFFELRAAYRATYGVYDITGTIIQVEVVCKISDEDDFYSQCAVLVIDYYFIYQHSQVGVAYSAFGNNVVHKIKA